MQKDESPMSDSDEQHLAVVDQKGTIINSGSYNDALENAYGMTGITEDEKQLFLNNRGRQEALAKSLAECFGITFDHIEIGATTISKYGGTTHIVHYGMIRI